jgi:hypothetical protein
MRINIHIDRLILDGLPIKGADAQAIRNSLQLELERLNQEQGLHPSLNSSITLHTLSADPVTFNAKAPCADSIGKQVASSIYGSFR